MKGLITTIKQIWSVEELRNRIIYTLGLILVYRIGSFIVLPGVNTDALSSSASHQEIKNEPSSDDESLDLNNFERF